MADPRNDGTVEIEESQLSDVQGGMLLPAVQKVREAAARIMASATDDDATVGGAVP